MKKTKSAPSLHLVDTSFFLFRAWASIPASILLPGTKQPANALYGLLQTLAKLVREESAERVITVLDDVAADAERIALEPAYKADRREFPGPLEAQAALVPEALAAAGFATARAPGWEADDVIATLARLGREARQRIVIVGNDKDLLQALEPGDELFDLPKDRHVPYEETSVVLGVPAPNVPDFLALAGDAVDRIEGVPGIGKKTAALLVNALGSLDEIYLHLDRVSALPGLRGAASIEARLREHEPAARKARVLATLKTHAPVELDLARASYRGTTEEGRRVLKERFGFGRLPERLPRAD